MGNASDHAILSPSGASRWLACTPSARLEQQFPNNESDAAAEGTLAHALGEAKIRLKAGMIDIEEYTKIRCEICTFIYYSAEMESLTDDYADYVIEQFNNAKAHTKDAVLLVESKLDLTEYVPEGFGTGDVIIIADSVLDFIDLKYGKGVPVSAVENKQMMLYALGALHAYGFMYDIHTVRMTIYQPRIDNISTYEMSVMDLYEWAEKELKPKAQLAFNGEGKFNPGNACRFCRAKAVCKANADYNLQLAKYDFMDPKLLSDEEITDVLTRSDNFTNWLKAVNDHALLEAANGKKFPGYKLVEGRSNRTYTDADMIFTVLTTDAKIEASKITEPVKLLPITKLEKAISKQLFANYVSPYVVKPQGKPTLVPESDKRPELSSVDSAALDFAHVTNEELL